MTWVDVVSSDDDFPIAILPQNEGRSSTNTPRLAFPSEVQKWQADIMKLVKAPQNEHQQVQIHGQTIHSMSVALIDLLIHIQRSSSDIITSTFSAGPDIFTCNADAPAVAFLARSAFQVYKVYVPLSWYESLKYHDNVSFQRCDYGLS